MKEAKQNVPESLPTVNPARDAAVKPKRIRTEKEKQRANELRRAHRAGPNGKALLEKRRAYVRRMRESGLLLRPKSTPEKRRKNADYMLEFRARNKEAQRTKDRERYAKNRDIIRERRRADWSKNKAEYALRRKKYAKPPKAIQRAYFRAYYGKRRKNDPAFKIISNFRTRLYIAVKNHYGKKARASADMVGCSIAELRAHLESLFSEGMNWSNYGIFGWHIDHIKPCASFDLSDPEQQKACFHYTNLQPLWWRDNLKKGSKCERDANPGKAHMA